MQPSSRSSSTCPLLARLTQDYDATGAALVLVRFLLAVPVGALVGGWALHRLGDGAVAGAGLALAGVGMLAMSRWTLDAVGDLVPTTIVLVAVGLGVGLALAPVNNAALADSPADAHGVASSLVVVARMVGMVVGLALLTTVGLHRYYDEVRLLPDPLDTDALIGAGVVQVQTVFLGGALAALLGAAVALTLGIRRPERAPEPGSVSRRSRPRRARDRTRPCPCAPRGRSPHRRPARPGRGSRGRSRCACPAFLGKRSWV